VRICEIVEQTGGRKLEDSLLITGCWTVRWDCGRVVVEKEETLSEEKVRLHCGREFHETSAPITKDVLL